MTPQQIALVQCSFKSVAPIASKAADLFYNRLFEIAPEVRQLFPTDLSGQKVKLMGMLATAINNLHRLDAILPTVRRLGDQHRDYGVSADHYAAVGAALLWTARARPWRRVHLRGEGCLVRSVLRTRGGDAARRTGKPAA